MTSLIDVIFLLLLFFMLSSTFSRFSEIELMAAGQPAKPADDAPPLFVQLGPDRVRMNGAPVALESLADTLGPQADAEAPRVVIVALRGAVTAQRLTDLLVVLRHVPGLAPRILGRPT